MKKWLLCLFCLLLAGCQADGPANGIGIDTNEDFSYYVNISTDAVWELTPRVDTELTYMLLSKEPVERVMIQNLTDVCSNTAIPCEEEWMTQFPLWLYQTYRGVDWTEAAEWKKAAQAGDAQAKEQLARLEDLYLEDYKALKPQDLPQFYAYLIQNNISDKKLDPVAGQHRTLEMSIGGEKICVDVGVLNISHTAYDLELDPVDQDIYLRRLDPACPSYWSDGSVQLAPIKLKALETSQTLTGVSLFGIEGQILDIQVTLTDAAGSQTAAWDGATALTIPSETSAEITLTLQTQANQRVGYCEDATIALWRQLGDQTQRLWSSVGISQGWNIYELYAMMVDGLDIGAYYAYSAQWQQPPAEQIPPAVSVGCGQQIVNETQNYRLTVLDATYDDHAYTMDFEAENRTSDILTLALDTPWINGCSYRYNPSIEMQPGQTVRWQWCIAWETLEEMGVHARSGEDIQAVSFMLVELYNGALPVDKDGNPIYSEERYTFYPLGEDAFQPQPPAGELLVQEGDVKLYAAGGLTRLDSRISTTDPYHLYRSALLLENGGDRYATCTVNRVSINGIEVRATAHGGIEAGGSSLIVLPVVWDDGLLERIAQPETLTMEISLNTAGTENVYTVTVDLTALQASEGEK